MPRVIKVPFNPVEIRTVSGFVHYLEKHFPEKEGLLFRGQKRDWPLIPRIGRENLKTGDSIERTERRMLEDLRLQGPSLLQSSPSSDWEWLSVGQHYGMATRFLDWTANALAALWFAVSEPPLDIEGTRKQFPGALWTFSPVDEDRVDLGANASPFSIRHTMVLRPIQISPRITAQSGWFTVHKIVEITGQERFIPLENQVRYRKNLTKFIIRPSSFWKIRFELDRCGVNSASLLADLQGLCQHITFAHTLLKDELP